MLNLTRKIRVMRFELHNFLTKAKRKHRAKTLISKNYGEIWGEEISIRFFKGCHLIGMDPLIIIFQHAQLFIMTKNKIDKDALSRI